MSGTNVDPRDARSSVVECRRRGGALIVTLNRPAALNALDDALLDALLDVWASAREADVSAVVLTGAGRAFCAGADIRAPARGPAEIARNQRARYNPNVLAMCELEKPVIAAVNGPAVGAGLALACAADLRVASERAVFIPGFASVGSVPDAGASFFLPRLVGYGRAFDWLLSNRRMDASEALACGLVDEVVPHDEVLARAVERSGQLARVPGRAVALTKRLLQGSSYTTLAEQLEREVRAQTEAVAAPGRAEARHTLARTIHDNQDKNEETTDEPHL